MAVLGKLANTHELGDKLEALAEQVKRRDADKAWMLILLRLFDKNNEAFDPNYSAPKRQKKQVQQVVEDEAMLDEYAEALKGMPKLKGATSKRKRLGGLLAPAAKQKQNPVQVLQ